MRVRLFGILMLALGLVATPSPAQQPVPPGVPGHGYVPMPNPMIMLEHLVRHSDMLVTNINLTRASGFRVEQNVIQGIVARPCWAASFYTDVIAAVRRPQDPDLVGFQVGQLVYQYRMKVIGLYDIAMNVGPSPQLTAHWEQVNFAYFNAISATYFYIEALRRGLLLPQPPPEFRNRDLLLKRLTMLQNNAAEVQNLMYAIRYAAPFRFPLGRNCIECSFAPHRLNVAATGPNEVLFPYYANQRVQFPDQQVRRVEAPAQYNPIYTQEVWNNRWNNIDQGYLQPGQQNRSFGGPQGGVGGVPPQNGAGFGGQNYPQQGGQGFGQGGQNPGNGGYVPPFNPANPNSTAPGNNGGSQFGPQPLQNGGSQFGPQPVQNGGQPVQQQPPQQGDVGQGQGQSPQPGDGGQGQGQAPQQGQGGQNGQPLPQMPQGNTGGTTTDYSPGAYDY